MIRTNLVHDFVQTTVSSSKEDAATGSPSDALDVHAVGWDGEQRLGQQMHLCEARGKVLLWLCEADAQQHDVDGCCHAQQVLDVRLENTYTKKLTLDLVLGQCDN